MCVCAKSLQSCSTLCDPLDCTLQAPLSMRFSRQKYWSGVPCSPPGDLFDPGTKPPSLLSPAMEGRFFTTSTTWEALQNHRAVYKSRLLFRTLLAAEVDTNPDTPALHTAPRPHVCGRSNPALWGTSLISSHQQTWRTLQERGLLRRGET